MSQLKRILRNTEDSSEIFARIKNYYDNKFYNKFLNKFEIDETDYQERMFILRMFYDVGTLGAIKVENSESEYNPSGDIIFLPYAPNLFNIYDYPVDAIPINKRGLSFIPNIPLRVGEEIVIGFLQPNRKGIREVVNYYTTRIAEVETTIRTNLFTHKMPFVIATTPENRSRMKSLIDKVVADDMSVLVDVSDVNNIQVLNVNNNFIIDKLKAYSNKLENELLEFLGFNNLGEMEKKEHLITSEVEVNNEITESSNDLFLDGLKCFFDEINKLFGTNYKVRLKNIEKEEVIEDEGDKDDDNHE